MNILLTGADGYLGWPTFLKLSRAFPTSRIVGVDNFGRRAWVQEVGSTSAIPIASMGERIGAARQRGFHNIDFFEVDLTDYLAVKRVISSYRPAIVIHTAAQPSAPYAGLNAEKALFTQMTNVSMTLNLLWSLREEGCSDTHFIETTTTGIYGAPAFDIPEGDIEAVGADGRRERVPYPNMASSWYHVSKGFNATNMQLMHFQCALPMTDVRTSIVYGTDTSETALAPELGTRFDFDFYFGTLFNRWMLMAVIGEPLIVYGKGTQIKPFVHLEDAAQSLVTIAQNGNLSELRVYNQVTECIMIRDLADMIVSRTAAQGREVGIRSVPNPRKEAEDRTYRFMNARFLTLLTAQPRSMKDSIAEVFTRLLPHRDRAGAYKNILMN